MNKLFTKIAALSVGLAMAIGVGVAVGSESKARVAKAATETFTINLKDKSLKDATTYQNEQTTSNYDGGDATASLYWGRINPSNGQVSGNSTTQTNLQGGSANFYVHNTTALSGNIRTVTISGITGTYTANKAYVQTGSSEITEQSTDDSTAGTNGSSSVTWSFTGTSGGYFAIGCIKTFTSGSVYATSIVITYETSSTPASTMLVKNSSGNQSPFSINYGASGGMLFYAYESDGTSQITSGITWTVSSSSILTLTSNYADNHCLVVPGQPGEATLTASKSGYSQVVSTITVEKGTLSNIVVSGSMSKTGYKLNDDWSSAGFTVTANYSTGYSEDVTNDSTWSYVPAKASSTSTTSVVATASYGGKTDSSSAQTVSVVEGVTYDLTKIDGFSSWTNSYGAHDLTQDSFDPAVGTDANLNFLITNKQGSGIGSTYPCIGAKTESETTCLTFTLTETGKKISSVDIVFVTRYTATYPSLYLHKGNGIVSTEISSITMSGSAGNETTLSCNNLNDTVFTVGYNAHQTGSNGAVGIKSISIGLAEQASFGTLDHISVSALPNTVYHVGETFNNTGLAVTAYDGVSEATANFKDVTSLVTISLSNGHEFQEEEVPGFDVTVSYTGDGGTDDDSFHVSVYALAEYELVTEEPSNWSGNYLIVGTNGDSELGAMNGGLANPDVEKGYKVVTEKSEGLIEAGQELEWTIAQVTGGYSIQGKGGKFIGSLTAKSNGMLVSDSALVNTLSLSGTDVSITGTNTYSLTLNTTGDRFRYYSGGTVKLYKLKASDAASDYADEFLEMLSTGADAVCKYNEDTGEVTTDLDDLKVAWAILAADYNSNLSNPEKEQFREGVASETGTNIQQAIALYVHIATAYGTRLQSADCSNYNFMGRSITPVGSIRMLDSNTSNTVTMTIVVSSIVAVIAVVGYFFFRKRKEN